MYNVVRITIPSSKRLIKFERNRKYMRLTLQTLTGR